VKEAHSVEEAAVQGPSALLEVGTTGAGSTEEAAKSEVLVVVAGRVVGREAMVTEGAAVATEAMD